MRRRIAGLALSLVMLAFGGGWFVSPPPAEAATGEGSIYYDATPVNYTEAYVLGLGQWCCNGNLYAISPDGSGHRRLASSAMTPHVSPDGKQIAIAGGDGDLYVVGRYGGNKKKVLETPDQHEFWPTWAPDGNRLAFVRWDTTGSPWTSAIHILDLRTGRERRLTHAPTPFEQTPSWSPDGKWIAFIRFDSMEPGNDGLNSVAHVHLIRPDGSRLRRLTHGVVGAWRPSWSPDSSWIAYSASSSTDVGTVTLHQDDIFAVRVKGGDPVQVTEGPALDTVPCWSPDGRRIAFSRAEGVSESYSVGHYSYGGPPADLFSVARDGSDLRQITNTLHLSEDACDWAH